jgi:hypothetical protein
MTINKEIDMKILSTNDFYLISGAGTLNNQAIHNYNGFHGHLDQVGHMGWRLLERRFYHID